MLGRTLDELPPQTRKLLRLIVEWVDERCQSLEMSRSDYRFSRREVRTHTNWSDTALKIHLARLAEMEYLLIHRGGRGQSYAYELLYSGDGSDDAPHLSGLIDVERLTPKTGLRCKTGQGQKISGPGPVSPRSVGSQGVVTRTKPARKPAKPRAAPTPMRKTTKKD